MEVVEEPDVVEVEFPTVMSREVELMVTRVSSMTMPGMGWKAAD
jgi:hypothetical protein